MKEVQELNEKGYAKTSSRLLYYIRKNGIQDIKIFRTGTSPISKGSRKNSSFDIFGDHYSYCFDLMRKKEFVAFLVAKFFKRNKNPDENIRRVFTRLLHYHGLHWDECSCVKKDKDDSLYII